MCVSRYYAHNMVMNNRSMWLQSTQVTISDHFIIFPVPKVGLVVEVLSTGTKHEDSIFAICLVGIFLLFSPSYSCLEYSERKKKRKAIDNENGSFFCPKKSCLCVLMLCLQRTCSKFFTVSSGPKLEQPRPYRSSFRNQCRKVPCK